MNKEKILKISNSSTSFQEKGEEILRIISDNIKSIIHSKLNDFIRDSSSLASNRHGQRFYEDENIIVEVQKRTKEEVEKLSTIKSSEYEKVILPLNSKIVINKYFKQDNGQIHLRSSIQVDKNESIYFSQGSIISIEEIERDLYFLIIFNKRNINEVIKVYDKKSLLLKKTVSSISKDSRIKIWTNFIIERKLNLDLKSFINLIKDATSTELKIDLLRKMYFQYPKECLSLLTELRETKNSFSKYSIKILKNLERYHV